VTVRLNLLDLNLVLSTLRINRIPLNLDRPVVLCRDLRVGFLSLCLDGVGFSELFRRKGQREEGKEG
jgi:hypothetical protein